MLAAAVHTGKGLFVQQTYQIVALGHLLHGFHHQLVLVVGRVGIGVNGGHLMLGRGHLIVLGL